MVLLPNNIKISANTTPLEGFLPLQDRENKESTSTLKKQFQGSSSLSQRQGNYHSPPLQRKENLSKGKHFLPSLLGTLDSFLSLQLVCWSVKSGHSGWRPPLNCFPPKSWSTGKKMFWPLGSITLALLSAQKNSPTSLPLERGLDNSSLPLKLYF